MLWLYAGVALSDWSTLPDSLKPALEAIALHGTEENFERVEKMSPEAFEESVDAIRLAALIYMRTGWRIRRKKLFSNRSKQKRNRGVTILARAVVVRNLSSAACIKRSNWVSALILHPIRNLRLSDHPTGNNPAAIKNCTPITAIPQRNTTTSAGRPPFTR